MSHGGQRDAERFAHVTHVAAGVVGDVEEHLRLGIGEVELGGALPQDLAERGAAQGIQQIEQALGLLDAPAGARRRHGPQILQPSNSLVN